MMRAHIACWLHTSALHAGCTRVRTHVGPAVTGLARMCCALSDGITTAHRVRDAGMLGVWGAARTNETVRGERASGHVTSYVRGRYVV
eukprot:5583284-Prymnesium_polylepis.1